MKGLGLDECYEFEVGGVTGRGRLQLEWRKQVKKDRVNVGMLRRVTGVIGDVVYLGFIVSRQTTTSDLGKMSSKHLCVFVNIEN